jgi:NDP-sugar pyrophosphorylase family protein
MILAAGKGERLRPLTIKTPKPAIPLGGKPLILRTLFWLKDQGIQNAIVNLYYQSSVLLDILSESPIPLSISLEEKLLGTGGGIRRSLPLWKGEWLLVLNGDTLLDLDLKHLFSTAQKGNIKALLVLREDPDLNRWGAVYVGEARDGIAPILSFLDPPSTSGRAYMFAGVHLIHRSLAEKLPPVGCVIRNGYQKWVSEGEPIGGYFYSGPWMEIGTPEQYRQAEELFSRGSFPWLMLQEEKISR